MLRAAPVGGARASSAQELGQQQQRPGTPGEGRGGPDDRPSTAPGLEGRPGTARLFRDAFLDTNPILLQYLAEGQLGRQRPGSGGQESGAGPSSGGSSRRPSFADRLRSTAATMTAAAAVTSAPPLRPSTASAGGGGRPPLGAQSSLQQPPAREAAERSLVAGANPLEVIRGLVARCEQLEKERQQAQMQLAKVMASVEGKASPLPAAPQEAEPGADAVRIACRGWVSQVSLSRCAAAAHPCRANWPCCGARSRCSGPRTATCSGCRTRTSASRSSSHAFRPVPRARPLYAKSLPRVRLQGWQSRRIWTMTGRQ